MVKCIPGAVSPGVIIYDVANMEMIDDEITYSGRVKRHAICQGIRLVGNNVDPIIFSFAGVIMVTRNDCIGVPGINYPETSLANITCIGWDAHKSGSCKLRYGVIVN